MSALLNFSRGGGGGGGRKFAQVQRYAHIYDFSGDTDLGQRDIYK